MTEAEIGLIYGDPDVKFTLDEFTNMTKAKLRLQIYRKELKSLFLNIK